MLGMANRSDLSARVSAMLDGNQRRGRAGFLAAAGATAAAALVLAAIGPLTAVAQSSRPRNGEARPRIATALDKALYEAAEAGDLQDIEELLKSGASVNAVIHGDGTPLLGAARKGQIGGRNLAPQPRSRPECAGSG